jgi:hypothetical protein
MEGTSFVAASIFGLCALLRGAYPELAIVEIKTILKAFATKI